MSTPTRTPKSAAEQYLERAFSKVKPEIVLAELDDILATRPTREQLFTDDDDVLAWIGRVKAALNHWDAVQAT
jgi:hypothetical protein